MNKKLETALLIASLEKAGRKTKAPIWSDLAERLKAPHRHNINVNLREINVLARQFKGKTLLVPGKVLGKGTLEEKVDVVAVSASEGAAREIGKKGKFTLLEKFVENVEKVKVSEIALVK